MVETCGVRMQQDLPVCIAQVEHVVLVQHLCLRSVHLRFDQSHSIVQDTAFQYIDRGSKEVLFLHVRSVLSLYFSRRSGRQLHFLPFLLLLSQIDESLLV